MDKAAIKNFAVNARLKLMADVAQKAYQLGITKGETKEPEVYQDGFRINQQFFRNYEIIQREKLIQEIKEKSFEQVIEEVAYTWFNRLIAIRFMEVNDYLPTGVRIFSSIIEGKVEPDAVTEVDMIADELDLDMDIVYRLQDEKDTDDLFKYVLVKQCNKLGEIMPVMFETIQDYTELLLPDQLLSEGSVVRDMVSMIDEEDWTEQVEIIGWLYQYYISEKKDEVFAGLRKNEKITKENIPAATQLFTPKWIVQYMVENSLGRLWLESHSDKDLQEQWGYFIEEAEQEPEVQIDLDKLKNPHLKPEDITILDPSMGSGHILVYAFDVLYEIYQSTGYAQREIPKLILEKNIYGLDIDDRAAQLGYFALIMKACSYNRRILDESIHLNVCSIQQSNHMTKDMVQGLIEKGRFSGDKAVLSQAVNDIVDVFYDAKEFGSILGVEAVDFELLEEWIEQLHNDDLNDLFAERDKETVLEEFPALILQAKVMSRKYDVVVTNPPYMGRKGMNNKLVGYVDQHFKKSKSDLYAVFMEVCTAYLNRTGYLAMINQHSWMFLSSFEKLREKVIKGETIISMLHLGPRTFEEIGGEVVQSTAFVLRNNKITNWKGTYIRLTEERSATEKQRKALMAIRKDDASTLFNFIQDKFSDIPGSPIAYWVSQNAVEMFKNPSINSIASVREGLKTADNERFIRKWFEVNFERTNINTTGGFKWVKHTKGGSFRKWYGNNEDVLNYENDGFELRNFRRASLNRAK